MKNKTNMLGRTMFETIAAISIVGLIATGLYKVSTSVLNRYKLGRIGLQVSDLQKNITFFHMVKGSYYNLSWESMLEKRIIPSDLKKNNSEGEHVFNGAVKIGHVKTADDMSDEASRFYILFKAKSGGGGDPWIHACTSFADMDWIADGTSNLVQQCYGENCDITTVNGHQKPNSSCTCSITAPASNDALSKCSSKANVLWIFE